MASSPAASSDSPCYLLELPPELRVLMYSFLYSGPLGLSLDLYDEAYLSPVTYSKPDNGALALLQTCKTIHFEATATFHDALELDVDVREDFLREHHIGDKRCIGPVTELTVLKQIKVADICVSAICKNSATDLTDRVRSLLGAMETSRSMSSLTLSFFGRGGWQREWQNMENALSGIKCKGIKLQASQWAEEGIGREKLMKLASRLSA